MKSKTVILTVSIFFFSVFNGFAQNTSASLYLFQENFAQTGIYREGEDYYGEVYYHVVNIGFSAALRVIYDGFLPILDFVLPDSALAVLNKEELRLLKDKIYGKHLFRFLLTNIDRRNLESIQAFENAQPNRNLNKRDLVSKYIEYFPVPSWTPEINIYDNNTIEWIRGSEDNFKGTYRIENGFLVVFVTEQYIGTPDYILDRRWRWPSGVTYRDGTVFYREPIKMVFPVGDSVGFVYRDEYSGESWNLQRRQIGSIVWY
jgi:hypothetical protein